MNKYLIDLKMPDVKNAGPKARNDVNFFLQDLGYKLITLFYPVKYNRIITPLTLLPYSVSYLFKLFFLLKKNDIVLIQFPIPHFYIHIFSYLKKIKSFKVVFLIHDLENFRKGKSVEEDLVFFKDADVIISHNPKMTSLISRPFLTSKIIPLQVFDYKVNSDSGISEADNRGDSNLIINYAGNLAPDKSGFVYNIPSLCLKENIKVVIYGINYRREISNSNIEYGGEFSPDYPDILKGDFGLVWDGNSLETCEGIFGSYLRVNNPHKLSLYLAASMPVIVWKHAAIASFVLDNNLGIAVDSLTEIKSRLEALTENEKFTFKNNAVAFGNKVRAGYFIKSAVEKAEKF